MDLNVGLPGNDGRNAVVEALWAGICRNNGRRYHNWSAVGWVCAETMAEVP